MIVWSQRTKTSVIFPQARLPPPPPPPPVFSFRVFQSLKWHLSCPVMTYRPFKPEQETPFCSRSWLLLATGNSCIELLEWERTSLQGASQSSYVIFDSMTAFDMWSGWIGALMILNDDILPSLVCFAVSFPIRHLWQSWIFSLMVDANWPADWLNSCASLSYHSTVFLFLHNKSSKLIFNIHLFIYLISWCDISRIMISQQIIILK